MVELYNLVKRNETQLVLERIESDRDNINWQNKNQLNWSILHCASYLGFDQIVQIIFKNKRTQINLLSKSKETPFYLCCSFGRAHLVKLMVKDPRVDVIKSDANGCSPLMIASYYGHDEIVKILLESGRYIAVNQLGTSGPFMNQSALTAATNSQFGSVQGRQVVQQLLLNYLNLDKKQLKQLKKESKLTKEDEFVLACAEGDLKKVTKFIKRF